MARHVTWMLVLVGLWAVQSASAVDCSVCGRAMETTWRCGKCKSVNYCSADCQRADWPRHKPTCERRGADGGTLKARSEAFLARVLQDFAGTSTPRPEQLVELGNDMPRLYENKGALVAECLREVVAPVLQRQLPRETTLAPDWYMRDEDARRTAVDIVDHTLESLAVTVANAPFEAAFNQEFYKLMRTVRTVPTRGLVEQLTKVARMTAVMRVGNPKVLPGFDELVLQTNSCNVLKVMHEEDMMQVEPFLRQALEHLPRTFIGPEWGHGCDRLGWKEMDPDTLECDAAFMRLAEPAVDQAIQQTIASGVRLPRNPTFQEGIKAHLIKRVADTVLST
ncbi:unnamed protein product (mitochondrion) [Plasmodiophora brassicae]|uniref:MYND-type domain-containing protein n=1 Tax=Plasmodiophora brassicae TaxID=37360 RepID=A0A0G4J0Q1_PLABS|nr:hypothetical protein PBRA_008198 [Plasmodiophora brassicae]SPR01192.1 unnamed protein product [Plasmodiophora brassicae]